MPVKQTQSRLLESNLHRSEKELNNKQKGDVKIIKSSSALISSSTSSFSASVMCGFYLCSNQEKENTEVKHNKRMIISCSASESSATITIIIIIFIFMCERSESSLINSSDFSSSLSKTQENKNRALMDELITNNSPKTQIN